MSRSRRRTRAGARTGTNPQEGARPAGPSARDAPGNQRGAPPPAMLRTAFERAADMAKKELGSKGRVAPMAVFGYRPEGDSAEGNSGVFKVVSLVWRTELQREAVKRRIREKAAAEGATALVVLTRADREGAGPGQKDSPEQKGVLVFSGAMREARAIARVTYVLQKETKTLTSWEMHLSAEAPDNFFLEGVFAPPGTGKQG